MDFLSWRAVEKEFAGDQYVLHCFGTWGAARLPQDPWVLEVSGAIRVKIASYWRRKSGRVYDQRAFEQKEDSGREYPRRSRRTISSRQEAKMKFRRLVGIALLTLVATATIAVAQVRGSGTRGKIAVWSGSTSIANSNITEVSGGIQVTGAATSISGVSTSATGIGIFGHATATAGNTSAGVIGQADSSGGASGVYGHAAATTGTGNGVFGQTDAPNGAGVFGIATLASGSAAGGVFYSSGPAAAAVYGDATSKTGVGGAVIGQNDSDDPGGGSGLTGVSTTTTGTAQGIYAETHSSLAVVALFRNYASGNIIIGQVSPTTNVFRVDGTGKGFFDGGTQTGGADFAESVSVAGSKARYEPADLLAVNPASDRRLTLASHPYSTLVAGIYSTKPGVLASTHKMDAGAFQEEVPLAVVGIVPCKISAENGPISPGDLLVASSTPGYAMKGTDRRKMLGAVVGKAMQPFRNGKGVIQVLVTLQ